MKKKIKFRIVYNAPVTLTFSIICTVFFLIDHFLLKGNFTLSFLSAPACPKVEGGFNPSNVAHYVRLFVHVLGHTDWNHLLGNLSFVLLLGPLLEERYGSKMLLLMILVTSLVTGVINACLIPSQLCGASGIVFMMIVLASITKIEKNVIPLSFIFVVALFFGREFLNSPKIHGVSTIAHVAGGLCGSMFGFLVAPKSSRSRKKNEAPENNLKQNDESKKKKSGIFAKKQSNPDFEDMENNSDRQNPSQKNSPSDSDETVIGTLDL